MRCKGLVLHMNNWRWLEEPLNLKHMTATALVWTSCGSQGYTLPGAGQHKYTKWLCKLRNLAGIQLLCKVISLNHRKPNKPHSNKTLCKTVDEYCNVHMAFNIWIPLKIIKVLNKEFKVFSLCLKWIYTTNFSFNLIPFQYSHCNIDLILIVRAWH